MRCVLTLVVITGCASGTSPNATSDGPAGQQDAQGSPIDAAPPIDGLVIDATPPADAAVTTDAPPDACVPQVTEILLNRNFDTAPTGVNWTQLRYDTNIPLVVSAADTGFAGQSGTLYAWLGGYESGSLLTTADDAVYQDFVVPPLTTAMQLTGYVAVGTDELGGVYDIGALGFLFPNAPATPPLIVLDLDNTTAASAGTWTQFTYNFTANYSGQTLRLQMETSNDISYATSFLFDTLSVRATHGCP